MKISFASLLKVIKILLFIGMSYFLVSKLSGFQQREAFFSLIYHQAYYHYGYLILAILLMPVNWFLEVLKWKKLLEKTEKITLIQSAKSVLGGLSIGFATPSRIGEFGGRVLFLEEGNRAAGIYLSALGGLAQSVFTIGVPFIFLPFYIAQFQTVLNSWHVLGLFVVAIFLLIIFFSFEGLIDLLSSLSLFKFFQKYIITPNKIPTFKQKSEILAYSGTRYLVYVSQMLFLLKFIGDQNDFFLLLSAISLFLLLTSITILSPFIDIAIRGGIMSALFYPLAGYRFTYTLLPVLLWLINLLLPALLGYYFILKIKVNDN